LIAINHPYYGCITGTFNYDLYEETYLDKKDIPESVLWVNYWGNDIVENMDLDKGNTEEQLAKKVYEFKKLEEGYFIRLSKDVASDQGSEVFLQKEVNSLLNLKPTLA
jgi:hypothetical protein